ncbi:helix-turn-helix domain-containing protein [Limimaricola sp.]|uniref:winged helix-turn-helix domain-containing protein n=1 Tax=Limimaricola sp. TaxID=2211665 RepID=UPI0025C50C91|nr:helix-turn-helix domain-containing protein [Limimaricola sp.]
MAHPDRLRMLGILRFDGPDTASGLAKRMGLTSGATSYHLRHLARHGYIDEAQELGIGREKFWRACAQAGGDDPAQMDEGRAMAELEMARALIGQHTGYMQQALAQFPGLSPDWRAASNASDYILSMTAPEARALKDKLTALLWEEVRKNAPADTKARAGTRQFMVMLHAFPFPGAAETGPEEED